MFGKRDSNDANRETVENENDDIDFVFILKQLAAKKSKQLLKMLISPTTLFSNGEPKFLIYNEKVSQIIIFEFHHL